MFRYLLCIIIPIIFMAGALYAQDELKPMQKAPFFMLKAFDSGLMVRSNEIFSQKELTVLIFWDSYCSDCLKAVAECQKFFENSKGLDVSVWSINFDKDNIAKARAFMKAEGIKFPVLSDPIRAEVDKYKSTPYSFSFFIIDRNGIIRYVCYDHPPNVANVIEMEVKKLLKIRLKVSELAPEFSLKTLDEGKTVKSDELFKQKKLTVLVFWNSNNKKCLDAFIKCEGLYKKSENLDFAVISINFDKTTTKAENFAKEKALTIPILFDNESNIAKAYKTDDYCFSVFIIDEKGIVKYVSYEPLPEIAKAIEGEISKLEEIRQKS